jgi:hypothetical protein
MRFVSGNVVNKQGTMNDDSRLRLTSFLAFFLIASRDLLIALMMEAEQTSVKLVTSY